MIKYTNDCVGCPPEMGCLGHQCPYLNVPHFICDRCGDDLPEGELYEYDGDELCSRCILKSLDTVHAD